MITGKRPPEQITADIQSSNAIFVLLSQHVEQLPHTRDWVVWESGTASGLFKDVWVLEAVEDTPSLSVVIPRVRHYVRFDYTNPWLIYLRQIVASYDDSHVFKAVTAGAGLVGALSESVQGALVGGGLGLLLALNGTQPRPAGLQVMCPNCSAFYNVHLELPTVPTMRCPVCNARLSFSQTQAQGV